MSVLLSKKLSAYRATVDEVRIAYSEYEKSILVVRLKDGIAHQSTRYPVVLEDGQTMDLSGMTFTIPCVGE